MTIDHKEGKGSGGANCGHKGAGYMPGKGVYCPTCSSEHKEDLPFPDRNEVDEPKDFSPEGWEERFDKRFVILDSSGSYEDELAQILSDQNPDPIKSFIRSELSAALKEERAKIIKGNLKGERNRIIFMIREEERKRVVEIVKRIFTTEEMNDDYADGYAQALSDIASKLESNG